MTAPETPTVIDVSLPKKDTFNALVTLGCLVMIGFMCYLAWKSHRRMEDSEARFQEGVQAFKERVTPKPDVADKKEREIYNASPCGDGCAEGHTYQPGCIQYVEPETTDAEAL
jgi:hypothetical protein